MKTGVVLTLDALTLEDCPALRSTGELDPASLLSSSTATTEIPILQRGAIMDSGAKATRAMDETCETPNAGDTNYVGREDASAMAESPTLSSSMPQHSDDGDIGHAKHSEDVDPTEATSSISVTPRQGFVGRILREYTLKREINAILSKKQQQLKTMQVLVTTYQLELQRCRKDLDVEYGALVPEMESTRQSMTRKIAALGCTGSPKELIDCTRCLGQLEMQRLRILIQRISHRRTVVDTRHEECEWLVKSIVVQHERECEELVVAAADRKFLEEGSLQATLSEQITQHDPFFTPLEQLFFSQPIFKHYELQLRAIDELIKTMKLRQDDLEAQYIKPCGPTPLVKRSSFRERRGTEICPSADRKRELRLILNHCRSLQLDRTRSPEEQRRRYTEKLDAFCRVVPDLRTRSGRLLRDFVERVNKDTSCSVRILRYPSSENSRNAAVVSNHSLHRFFAPGIHETIGSLSCHNAQPAYPSVLFDGTAVDIDEVPPPGMMSAFIRFLTRVISTEYELIPTSPHREDAPEVDSPKNDVDRGVLQECVHELVFRKIPRIASGMAMDRAKIESGIDDDDDDGASRSSAGLNPWHWWHSKRCIQGVDLAELVFPLEAVDSIQSYLTAHEQQIARHGFLPGTLHLLQACEGEVTPKGVMHTIMAAFRTLHREVMEVLSFPTVSHNKPARRGSCFFNADVLIPCLVLMMSRLPHPSSDLNSLWSRVQLVHGFRGLIQSDGCEDAYYLTCLSAAMEFIQTYEDSKLTEMANQDAGIARQGCRKCARLGRFIDKEIVIELQAVGAGDRQVWSKSAHDSVRQLSQWISEQPASENNNSSIDYERVISAYELWTYSAEERVGLLPLT